MQREREREGGGEGHGLLRYYLRNAVPGRVDRPIFSRGLDNTMDGALDVVVAPSR